jgi:hypothetical protein
MRLFGKHVKPITLINNDEIFFIVQGGAGQGRISEPITLDRFLKDEIDAGIIPRSFRHQGNSVMVVPDYWLGNASFPFQSRRKSLAEAFLERKLRDEFPGLPGIKDFFVYSFYQTNQGETMLHAHFITDQTFFRVHDKLTERNLRPRRVTAPAFLWECKLREEVPGFQGGGKAFAHLLPDECFLYFFFEGRFLFSRQIRLPDFQPDPSDQIETLTYETNQSIYLFSQKARAEIDRFYMYSVGHLSASDLARRLGREVEEVSGLEEDLTRDSTTIGHPGLLSGFCLPDLSRSQQYLSISHRQIEREQQWKPVQKVGIAVGLILIFLLSCEGMLLWKWSRPVGLQPAHGATAGETEAVRALRQYNEALDLFLKESQRPSASNTIIHLAAALPEGVWIKEMVVETEPNPGVVLTGTVRAERPGQLRETLSEFLENLNGYFQASRSLGLQDIDFDTNNCKAEQGYHTCTIALRFGLP